LPTNLVEKWKRW